MKTTWRQQKPSSSSTSPQKNQRYEVYRLRETRQGNQESLDTFHTRLRQISSTCEFEDVDFEIEEQIIIGGQSSRFRRRALRDPMYTLKDMLIDGRRDETSSYQAHIQKQPTYTRKQRTVCNRSLIKRLATIVEEYGRTKNNAPLKGKHVASAINQTTFNQFVGAQNSRRRNKDVLHIHAKQTQR